MSTAEANRSSATELSRGLQKRHITLIGLGGVIGAGLFVGSSASISAVGPGVVLSYLLAGAVVYAVMTMLADLTCSFPGTPAFTDLVRTAAGPGMGFVIGWLYWYMWIVTMAVEALAGASLLQAWIPLPTLLLSLLLLLLLLGVNLLPTRSFGEFEFWFSSIKVVAIVGFVALGAVYCFGSSASRADSWAHLTAQPSFLPHGVGAVLTGVVSVFFSLTGAELTTIAAVESRQSTAATSRMAALLIFRIVLFYVGSVFIIVSIIPWSSIVPGISPFTTVLRAIGLESAESIMTAVILTAVLSCLNSGFYVSSRVLFSLAANRDAPQALVALTRRRVPARSVLLGAVAAAGCLVAAIISPGRAFAFLVNATGCLILFIYLGVCVAHLALRKRQAVSGESGRRVPVLVTYVAIAAMLGLLTAMAIQPQFSSQFQVSSVMLGLAFFAYIAVRKRRSGAR